MMKLQTLIITGLVIFVAGNASTETIFPHTDGSERAVKALSIEQALQYLLEEKSISLDNNSQLTVNDPIKFSEELSLRPTLRAAFERLAPGQSEIAILQGLVLAFAEAKAKPKDAPAVVKHDQWYDQTKSMRQLTRDAFQGKPFEHADLKKLRDRGTHAKASPLERHTLSHPDEILTSLKIIRQMHGHDRLLADETDPKVRLEKLGFLIQALHTLVAGHKPDWKYDLCSQTSHCEHLQKWFFEAMEAYEQLHRSLTDSEELSPLRKQIKLSEFLEKFRETLEDSAAANTERGMGSDLANGALWGPKGLGLVNENSPGEEALQGAQKRRDLIIHNLERNGYPAELTLRLRKIDAHTSAQLNEDFQKAVLDYQIEVLSQSAGALLAVVGGAGLSLLQKGKAVYSLAGLTGATALGGTTAAAQDLARQGLERHFDPGHQKTSMSYSRAGGAFAMGAVLAPLGARYKGFGEALGYFGAYMGGYQMAHHIQEGKGGSFAADVLDLVTVPAVVWGIKKFASRSQEFDKDTLDGIDQIFKATGDDAPRASAAEIAILEDIHRIGRGEPGASGKPASVGDYTHPQKQRKFTEGVDRLTAISLKNDPKLKGVKNFPDQVVKAHQERAIKRIRLLMEGGFLGDRPGSLAKSKLNPQADEQTAHESPPDDGTKLGPKSNPRSKVSGPITRDEIKAKYDEFTALGKAVAEQEAAISRNEEAIASLEKNNKNPADIARRKGALQKMQQALANSVARLDSLRRVLEPEALVRYAFEDRDAFTVEVLEAKRQSAIFNDRKSAAKGKWDRAKEKLRELGESKAPRSKIYEQMNEVLNAKEEYTKAVEDFEDNQWHMGLLQTANKLGLALLDGAVVLGVIDDGVTKTNVKSDFTNFSLGFNVARTQPYQVARGTNANGKAVGGYRDWVTPANEGDVATTALEGAISPSTAQDVYATPDNPAGFFARIAVDDVNPSDLMAQIKSGQDISVKVNHEGGAAPTAAKLKKKWNGGGNWNGAEGEAQGAGRGQLVHNPGGQTLKADYAMTLHKNPDGTFRFERVPITGKITTAAHRPNTRDDVVAITTNTNLGNLRKVNGVDVPFEIRRAMLSLVKELAEYRATIKHLRVHKQRYETTQELNTNFFNLLAQHIEMAEAAIKSLQQLKKNNPGTDLSLLESALAEALGARFSELAAIAPSEKVTLFGPGSGTVNNFFKVPANRAAFLGGQEIHLGYLANNIDGGPPVDPRTLVRTVTLGGGGSIVIP